MNLKILKDPFSNRFAQVFVAAILLSFLLASLSYFIKYLDGNYLKRGTPYCFWIKNLFDRDEPNYCFIGFFRSLLWWHTRFFLLWSLSCLFNYLITDYKNFSLRSSPNSPTKTDLTFQTQILISIFLTLLIGLPFHLLFMHTHITSIMYQKGTAFNLNLFIQSVGLWQTLFALFLTNLVLLRIFFLKLSPTIENVEKYCILWTIFIHIFIFLPAVWDAGVFNDIERVFIFWPNEIK